MQIICTNEKKVVLLQRKTSNNLNQLINQLI